jgi:hypothetical protein
MLHLKAARDLQNVAAEVLKKVYQKVVSKCAQPNNLFKWCEIDDVARVLALATVEGAQEPIGTALVCYSVYMLCEVIHQQLFEFCVCFMCWE